LRQGKELQGLKEKISPENEMFLKKHLGGLKGPVSRSKRHLRVLGRQLKREENKRFTFGLRLFSGKVSDKL